MPASFRDRFKEDTLSVTQLVRKMKSALQFEVGDVWVEGEVSNLRVQKSGHRYFTIKDAGAQLACVLFKGRSGGAGELIEDGRQVKLFGEITVYEAMGRAQMVVSKVKVGGEGDLQARFEELKQRLNAEGVFSSERKKALPPYPRSIGLITSPSGAALQDMLNVFSRRAPWVEIVLYGVQVQGKGAEKGIADAIKYFSEPEKHDLAPVDILIIGRGGGSIEDLWNFNEEVVARAIYDCPVPVISAVGHEIDFTIADFVADHRAPTPSAAAEIAVPDSEGILNYFVSTRKQLDTALQSQLEQLSQKLAYLEESLNRKSPERIYEDRVQLLGDLQDRLYNAFRHQLNLKASQVLELRGNLAQYAPGSMLENYQEKLRSADLQLTSVTRNFIARSEHEVERLSGMIRTLGPEATLARGYSITTKEDGTIVTDPQAVKKGDRIKTKVLIGEVESTVD